MEPRILSTLAELEAMENQPGLPEPLYRISAENGQFLNILVRSSGAKRILEIGSSSGYSGIYLAEAARANGGTVTTCELSAFKVKLAGQMYEKAGVEDVIHIIEGDARKTLQTLDGEWDFVFIDAWKDDYPAYLELVWPHVKVGGVVAADDIISARSNAGIQAYLRQIQALPDARSVTVPIDDGVELTTKSPT